MLRAFSALVSSDPSADEQLAALLERPAAEVSPAHKRDLMHLELLAVLRAHGPDAVQARLGLRLPMLDEQFQRFQLQLTAQTLERAWKPEGAAASRAVAAARAP
jgi:hypothetical protein